MRFLGSEYARNAFAGGAYSAEGREGREEEGREGGFTPHFSLPSASPAYNNKPWDFPF